jgi:uncharacterized LabA/DUF88 family protein
MDLSDLKNQFVREEYGISVEYGKIFSFIDFSNVNKWFDKDNQDWDNKLIAPDEKITIDVDKLKLFSSIFSEKIKVYYGEDPKNNGSLAFTNVLRIVFNGKNVITKDLQRIKHYLTLDDKDKFKKYSKIDGEGKEYVEIRKCNFDVEISVDALKMIDHYDSFCLFSGDADFVYLNNFLKKKGKKIILIKGGYITTKLKESADFIINAQNIKRHIARVEKQKPD